MIRSILRPLSHFPGAALLPGRVKAVMRACGNRPVFPTMVNIEPTRRCNLRCVMCPQATDQLDPRPDMTFEMFKHILCQFPDSLKKVTIQGFGEPLLNKSLLDMVEFCRGRGLETRLNTNMTIMTEEIAERLVRCGRIEVEVSIETTDPALFADIRRGAKLERVLHSLEILVKTKERLDSNLPLIYVHGILMKAVLPTIPAMVSTLRNAGVSGLVLSDLTVQGDVRLRDGTSMAENSLSATMGDGEIAGILAEIRRLETPEFSVVVPDGGYFGFCSGANRGPGILTCKELWESPYVTIDGYATPCCVVADPETFNLGNYNEMTFEEIWFGEPYQRLRWAHIRNNHPEVCRQCARLTYTFQEPSRLKRHDAIQKQYTKCFVSQRFVANRILRKMRPNANGKAPAISAAKPVEKPKLDPRGQRVVEAKRGHLAGPWEMLLFPTNRCNLKCNICWQRWAVEEFGEVDTKNEMPDERWLRLIDEGAEMGVREWTIVGGGEPMMRRDLALNMAKKICRLGMKCALHTNGTMLKADVIERLVDMGLDDLFFSIDAAARETNDDIRSPGSFDRATAAIRKVMETKRRRDQKKPKIHIAGVLTSTNYKNVVQFVEFFHELGCEEINLAALTEQGTTCKRFALNAEQEAVAIDNLRAAIAHAEQLGVETTFDVLVRRMEGRLSRELVAAQTCVPVVEGMCFEPWVGMTIQPNGITGPCCVSYDEKAPSIANMTLAEIWQGPYFEMLRERAAKNQPMHYCDLCPMHLIERTRFMKEAITAAGA